MIFLSGLIVVGFIFYIAINYESIARKRHFEAEITKAKSRRIELGITHYGNRNYQYYLGSKDWQTISKQARLATNWKCEFCGRPAKAVHHVYYPKNKSDLGLESIACLCVVCKKCHDTLHGKAGETNSQCALCGDERGVKKLIVVAMRLGNQRPMLCERCSYLSMGFREKAYKWTWEQYLLWINNWQQLVFAELVEMKNKRSRREAISNKSLKINLPTQSDKPIGAAISCSACGEDILRERVDLIPATTLCVKCKLNLEQNDDLVRLEQNDSLDKRRQITIEEAEATHIPKNQDPERVRKYPELLKPFGFMNDEWEDFKSKMQDGDLLWEFCSDQDSWDNLAGRAGIVLVRDGQAIASITTIMN